jgi:hypothetical protein
MHHRTGFTKDEIVDLCARVHAVNEAAAESEKVTWPPILGLFTSVVVALTYLRRNRIQAEIGESYGVSQSTISCAVTALTPLLGTTLALDVPVAEDLSSHAHYTPTIVRFPIDIECCPEPNQAEEELHFSFITERLSSTIDDYVAVLMLHIVLEGQYSLYSFVVTVRYMLVKRRLFL